MDVEMSDAKKTEQPKHEVTIDASFDESKVYSGKVKAFRPHFRVVITPNDDLSAIGVKNQKVEASVSDVHTSQSPVWFAKEQEVEFRLRKDNWGVYAIFVSGPNGSRVGACAEGPKPREEKPFESVNNGQVFQGTIKNFLWRQGFGYLTLDNKEAIAGVEIKDEKAKKRFEKSGEIWFARSHIKSTDAGIGCGRGESCQFTLYTDERGIGARDICRPGGLAFSGCRTEVYRGPKTNKKKKKKNKGQGPMQQQIQAALKKMMGFGKVRGGGMPMMIPMNGMNMMNPMMMMGGGAPYMMMMGGGKKKRKRKKKNKNKGGVASN